jgi:hypothetical protein
MSAAILIAWAGGSAGILVALALRHLCDLIAIERAERLAQRRRRS